MKKIEDNIIEKIERIKEVLCLKLTESRLNHSINVMKTAISISKSTNVNFEKVMIAGILHDVGKEYSIIESIDILEKNNIEIDSIERENTDLLHGKIGAFVAENEFGITDDDILNAIKYHTTGRKGMSILEKIIYISDYIEPSRSFKRVEEIREMSYIDIDKTLLLVIDDTINHIIDRKMKLHHSTIEARDEVLELLNKKRDGIQLGKK